MRRGWFIGVLALALLAGSLAPASERAQAESAEIWGAWVTKSPTHPKFREFSSPLVVSPSGPYFTIDQALAAAEPGDTIEVRGGVYAGPLVVDKGVTLAGVERPVIDAGGQGTVVTLAAPGIVFRGFEVRGSGREPDRDHSGILVSAAGVTVEDNLLRDVLFGVFVSDAPRAVVRGNDIASKDELELARRGDGLRVWYSPDVTVEGNTIRGARDIVVWYSERLVLRDNLMMDGRYGVHLMYCQDAVVADNQLINNSVGIYTMYTRGARLTGNLIRGQRGPSGYALGFKDADDVEVAGNALIDNRAGLYFDGTPFQPGSASRIHDNVIAFNDTGVILLPSARGNRFSANTFWENVEQTAFQGGNARPEANTWEGNTWSDYNGFDADGDGVGDVPYRAERLLDSLLDREPALRALLYSPAAQAVEFAGAAAPVFRPQPKLTDPAPRLEPAPLRPEWMPARRQPRELAAAALGLLGLTLGLALASRARNLGGSMSSSSSSFTPPTAADALLRVNGLGKHYGAQPVLAEVSFEARPGEAIALWGANGAGKSTLLKALLGLVDYRGQVALAGFDARRQGKAARRLIGYVPQETAFYDQDVRSTLEFFARLKGLEAGARPGRVDSLLEQLGLQAHARKSVAALSGGLRQRLALAVALLADPPVLLLDEPTANLDAQAQRDYLALLAHLRKEQRKTILFASHRLEEVELLATRVLWLEHGRLVESLSPAELLARLMPFVRLTLWVPETQRPAALDRFTRAGLSAHANGRGTLVVEVRAADKMQPLQLLSRDGIPVLNFEIERGETWK